MWVLQGLLDFIPHIAINFCRVGATRTRYLSVAGIGFSGVASVVHVSPYRTVVDLVSGRNPGHGTTTHTAPNTASDEVVMCSVSMCCFLICSELVLRLLPEFVIDYRRDRGREPFPFGGSYSLSVFVEFALTKLPDSGIYFAT